ncbi:hypothetical protein LIA77_04468 [Sarocladium implicatum]|nr:hypothetical protein LIA77_04468 [Sarocladium implicatum]
MELPVAADSPSPSITKEVSDRVPPALAGTRHIFMWEDYTKTSRIIKFVNVPDEYETRDALHADYMGMFKDFKNNETWLTVNGKRLFATPDYGDADPPPGAGMPDELPIMGPEELKEALKSARMSLEEYRALLAAATEKARAAGVVRGSDGRLVSRCSRKAEADSQPEAKE